MKREERGREQENDEWSKRKPRVSKEMTDEAGGTRREQENDEWSNRKPRGSMETTDEAGGTRTLYFERK